MDAIDKAACRRAEALRFLMLERLKGGPQVLPVPDCPAMTEDDVLMLKSFRRITDGQCARELLQWALRRGFAVLTEGD